MERDRHRTRINLVAGVAAVLVIVMAAVIVASSRGHHSHPRRTAAARHEHLPALPFASDSIWNAPLSADAAVDARSATYVSDLRSQVARYGTGIATTPFGVPIYIVPGQTRRVPVILSASGFPAADTLAAILKKGVPIPATARAARGTDEEMTVWQPATNTLWEFWHARKVDGTWHADWGGRIANVSHSPGYFTNPSDWGASATSLSIAGGMILPGEVRAGVINHALALAIPHAEAGHFVFPAQRDDGNEPSATAIPEGTRFRIASDVNITALHLPPITAMIARAVQRYGMFVRDQAGDVTFVGEDPASIGSDPWGGDRGLLEGVPPPKLLARFPWQDLQVVTPTASR